MAAQRKMTSGLALELMAMLLMSLPPWSMTLGTLPIQQSPFHVAVYGSTPAGITAAIAAARMNNSVVLLSQTQHIGGMVSGGLSHTDIIRPNDIDNRHLVGGIAMEFFELNTQWYHNSSHTEEPRASHPSNITENIVWSVEPHVAGIIFRRMLSDAGVTVVLNASITTVEKADTRIVSMRDQAGRQFAADMWIDASYEGDLLALAGASFMVGREPASAFNESLAGFTGGSSPQFPRYINPYWTNDPHDNNGSTERRSDNDADLIPLVDSIPADLAVGDGDNATSSYNFRLCITNLPDNRVPFSPPAGYNSSDYELVRRSSLQGFGLASLLGGPALPGGRDKYDFNGGGPVGSDFVGKLHGSLPASAWATANYTTRKLMWMQHKYYVQGLLWFLQSDTSMASELDGLRLGPDWGLCKDEFVDTDNWPPQLYIREARRLQGERIITQGDIVDAHDVGDEAVGLGGYVFDTHTARRYACTPGSPPSRVAQCTSPYKPRPAAYVWDESHMVSDPGLFQLQRSMLLPKRAEVTNLAVPTAVSASHVVFSSIRMEPQWMVLGHAAGALTSLARSQARPQQHSGAVQDVPATKLNAVLRAQGAKLDIPTTPQPNICMLNRCVPVGSTSDRSDASSTAAGCQFCPGLASNEWLAPVADFAPTSSTSTNITAQQPTVLQKALSTNGAQDKPIATGYSCERSYLKHFRGFWICYV